MLFLTITVGNGRKQGTAARPEEVIMQISINANRCEPSPMRKFHPYAVAAEAAGKKIYRLNIGQPDLPTPQEYYEAMRTFDKKTLGYAESPGMPVLIKAVQNYYKQLDYLTHKDLMIYLYFLCLLDPIHHFLAKNKSYYLLRKKHILLRYDFVKHSKQK